MQMLFFAMLIDAAHPALEDRKEPLNRIRVNVAAHIFAAPMNGRFVGRKFLADVAVKLAFIGV